MQIRSRALQIHEPVAPQRSPSRQQAARAVHRLLRPPASFVPALLDAGVWLASAIALRVLADMVLVIAPMLWVPVALMLCSPAIAAILLAKWAPQLSMLLGYRLVLIAMGLLIGGRV